MAEKSQATKAEELLAKLNQVSQEKDDHAEGRKKAASQWVAHFLAVAELDLTECKSVDDIEAKLIESWELKEAQKDEKVIHIVQKFAK